MGHSEVFHPPYDDRDIMQMRPTKAIEVIMDMYGDEIKRLIYTYMKNPADTDDVTQEVFITVYRKLSSFQAKSSLRSWIYAIAINQCKDHLRSWQSRNRRLKEKLTESAHWFEIANDSPEAHAIKQSESDQLLEHVMRLPVKYREVIILYHFEELSVKEVGDALRMKEATVRTRLKRGRAKLKSLLTERGGIHA